MPIKKTLSKTLTLFCKVVDNFGDIGICWRLARQFVNEHNISVNLWVDDLKSFQRICPEIVITSDTQTIAGVLIHHWVNQEISCRPEDITDIVIEFFACDIPPAYIAAMAQCTPPPVWLNLEGLTAEDWVEGCHTLPSPHPQFSLTKYFFFPGFTSRTAGLICEAGLLQQRLALQKDRVESERFLNQFGLSERELSAFKVSLFCYPHAPIQALLEAWKNTSSEVLCLIPEGVANESLQAFFGTPPKLGTSLNLGALTVRILPFIPQVDYDKLLWVCDFNFVRGEDSFVR
ncbi:MAG: elongation factor P maturation arginine rhamnosyltransferase EarP, partial [Undibacterium sp.]|nr:elongation factor P maturation arginine rhamnosyltransferase EarP [Undibacterium sp.]